MTTVIPRFSYRWEREGDEVFLVVRRFEEIVSAIPLNDFNVMPLEARIDFAHDAVITALVGRISGHKDLPSGDDFDVICDGFVQFDVVEAMTLTLATIYVRNFKSVAAFAAYLGKSETAAHRLLDFQHKSRPGEIEAALAQLGQTLTHDWHLHATAMSSDRQIHAREPEKVN